MSIDGIYVEKHDNQILCRIEDFSDTLKNKIRAELSSIAFGAAEALSLPDHYSYRNTLAAFLDRYNTKAEDTKKGMIGELLSHILIPGLFNNLVSLSILFNKEERSIKKGFDIVYCDVPEKSIWYSEVKSGGRPDTHTADDANSMLLDRAYYDLRGKFFEGRLSLWQSAIFDVRFALEESMSLSAKALLSADSPIVKQPQSNDKNAILVSVLYECPTNPFSIECLKDFFAKVQENGDFKNVIVFSIQKKTYDKVSQFLTDEAANV